MLSLVMSYAVLRFAFVVPAHLSWKRRNVQFSNFGALGALPRILPLKLAGTHVYVQTDQP